MGIHQKGATIDIASVKSHAKLEGDILAKKEARDAELERIIKGEDDRILLVIGPCSSDNESAVLEYAHRLAKLQEQVKDKVFMVMRVYTAKPRTNGDGYKGLMHQPDTSKLPDLINGIQAVRDLHYKVITQTGLTTADEMLYPSNLRMVDDLVSYHAIGARSVEDQEHRFVASGIDAPTGMKNPTSGNLSVMFNAIHVNGIPGQVIEKTKKSLIIATKKGAISLTIVQPAGKPKMPIQDFLNGLGKNINIGDQFE